MRILIAANHYPVASGRYMADAFRRLGHEVRTDGLAMGNNVWGITVDPKYIWTPTGTPTPPAQWADLVIVMDSDPAVWELVKRNSFECPVVVYGVDNHVRSYEGDLFEHYFLAHYHGPAHPVDPARTDHSWLPCASDPMFTPSPIAWSEREFDVCCVGVLYPRRLEVIDALKSSGLKVFAATGLLYEEYRAAYWNARISLCVSAAGDVAQRIFETGRMGCAILTDPLLDFADETTNKVLGIYGRMTYQNPAEAAVLARELLGSQPAFNIGVVTTQSQEPLGKGAALQLQKACMPHVWDRRAEVILSWYESEYGKDRDVTNPKGITAAEAVANVNAIREELNKPVSHDNEDGNLVVTDLPMMPDKRPKPYLNLGCGTTHFPSERPPGHELIDEKVYSYPLWLNVDKVQGVGADLCFDLFKYPWPLPSDSFDGAVLGHIVEHCPHEIKLVDYPSDKARAKELANLQDGWYSLFSELYRVLTPGAIAHIISPFAWSEGAIVDPTHTRFITMQSFTHGLSPEQYTGTFKYNIACNFEVVGHSYRYTEFAKPFINDPDLLQMAIMTRVNLIYDLYVQLKTIK